MLELLTYPTNLPKAQSQAIRELKRDMDHIVLTADKGVAMVIMDKQDYKNKSKQLLNQPTYRAIPWDPTNTIKNKLINILKKVKNQTGLDNVTYKSMYPTGCVPPKIYGLPNIHKPDTPLRPIVSSCRSVTYGVAKELTKIPKPSEGKSPHHINGTQDFVEQAKHITLAPGECLSLLWCVWPVHLSPSRSSPKSHQGSIGKRPHPQGKNSTPCRRHHSTARVLSQKHTLLFPRQVLWTCWGCGYGFPSKPYCR